MYCIKGKCGKGKDQLRFWLRTHNNVKHEMITKIRTLEALRLDIFGEHPTTYFSKDVKSPKITLQLRTTTKKF